MGTRERTRTAPTAAEVGTRFAAAERIIAVVALAFLTGGPVPLLFIMRGDWRNENDGRMFVWLWAFLAWLCVACWVHRRAVLFGIRRAGPLFVLAGWGMLTRFWSLAPGVTTLRAMALFTCALFGAYLGRRFAHREQLRLLALGLLVAGLLSLFWRLFVHLPYSTTIFSGGWQGIYVHSNYMGAVAALGTVVTALCIAGSTGRERVLWIPPLALHLLLLQKSIAAAGEFNALFAVMIFGLTWLYREVRRREGQWNGVLAGAGGLVVVALGLGAFETQRVADRLQSSGDWTNRITLWKAIWPWLAERPVEGFGLGAMWTYKGGWAKQIEFAWGRDTVVPHAHNGFLDLWLGTGLIGFEILLVVFGVAFARSAKDLYRGRTALSSWPIVLWFFITLSSLTESVMLVAPSIQLVILGAILAGGAPVPLFRDRPVRRARPHGSSPAPPAPPPTDDSGASEREVDTPVP